MAGSPLIRTFCPLLVPLLFALSVAPACSGGVAAAESQIGAPADHLAEVTVDARWNNLSAYNSRRSGAAEWDGKLEGYRTLWYDNGVKKGEGLFADNRKQGPWTWWFESGQKRWEGVYKDDRPDGFERGWYPNGMREYEGSFHEEHRSGTYTRWYDTGQLELRGEYVAGKREGLFQYWSFDGALDLERSGVYEADVKVSDS